MLSEYQKLINRENRIMESYHTSPKAWENFLATVGKFYEEVTSNQALIANQNPKATILKTVEEWNQEYCCYLKPEAKPIKLMAYDNGQRNVKAVYDIKDVCQTVDSIEIPKPWTIREEHKAPIMTMLEKEVGTTDPDKSFDERLMQIADIIIDYNKDDLAKRAESAGVYFTYYAVTAIQKEELKNKVRDTFSASLSYLLLSRCGSDLRTWRKQKAFSHLDGFRKLPAINWAACTITDFGKQVLLGIEKTVREYELQHTTETKPTKNITIVNMTQKETAEKQDRQEIQYPPVKIKRQKIDKVAETPVEKSYIRKKLDVSKQKVAPQQTSKTDNIKRKKEQVL